MQSVHQCLSLLTIGLATLTEPAARQIAVETTKHAIPLATRQHVAVADSLNAASRRALLAPVFFVFNDANLRDEERSNLAAKVGVLKAHPILALRLTGYADERGTRRYNQMLGQRRAATVRNEIAVAGLPVSRIVIVSRGEDQLPCKEKSETCWSKCRRVEVALIALPK